MTMIEADDRGMQVLSTAWINGSLQEFEASCCLRTHADMWLGSQEAPLKIYVLDGFQKLTPSFVASMNERHILFIDAEAVTSRYLESYRALPSMLSANQGATYETYCFIRWLVLEEMLGGQAFLHVDLDLFFQLPLKQISELFAGRTGTFGSPCLTSVGDPNWLKIYRESLDALIADRSAFQESIGYGGNEFRRDISSDQDLVIALEAAGILPRSSMDELRTDYSIFINPIWPFQFMPSAPLSFERRDGFDYVGGNRCCSGISRTTLPTTCHGLLFCRITARHG